MTVVEHLSQFCKTAAGEAELGISPETWGHLANAGAAGLAAPGMALGSGLRWGALGLPAGAIYGAAKGRPILRTAGRGAVRGGLTGAGIGAGMAAGYGLGGLANAAISHATGGVGGESGELLARAIPLLAGLAGGGLGGLGGWNAADSVLGEPAEPEAPKKRKTAVDHLSQFRKSAIPIFQYKLPLTSDGIVDSALETAPLASARGALLGGAWGGIGNPSLAGVARGVTKGVGAGLGATAGGAAYLAGQSALGYGNTAASNWGFIPSTLLGAIAGHYGTGKAIDAVGLGEDDPDEKKHKPAKPQRTSP